MHKLPDPTKEPIEFCSHCSKTETSLYYLSKYIDNQQIREHIAQTITHIEDLRCRAIDGWG